jgi:hypothetical protein
MKMAAITRNPLLPRNSIALASVSCDRVVQVTACLKAWRVTER